MFLGRVEALEHESIQTKFFVLGVPLIPLESFYVLAEEGRGVRGHQLENVHGASVLAGYLRILLGVGAAIAGVMAYVDHDGSWGLTVGLSVAFLASVRHGLTCPACQTVCEHDARFCQGCAEPLATSSG